MRRPHEARPILRDVIAAEYPSLYVGYQTGDANLDGPTLDALNAKGVAILIGRIENGNTRGGQLRQILVEWTVPVMVFEKPAQNESEEGFGVCCDEIADTLANRVLGHATLGPQLLTLANDFWEPFSPDKGLEGVVLRFVLKGQYTPT